MKTPEFVARVRQRARLASVDEAMKASRATLTTLRERLKGKEPSHLAAQLPPEIARYLKSDSAGSGTRFSADEFIRRVSEREGVDYETAREHARAIVEVLCEAVSEGEMKDVYSQLPRDYSTLFGAPTRH